MKKEKKIILIEMKKKKLAWKAWGFGWNMAARNVDGRDVQYARAISPSPAYPDLRLIPKI